MRLISAFFLLLILFFLSISPIYAGVVINEFSSSTTNDWVELFNTDQATNSADLSKYRLRDSSSTNKKDLTGTLAPGAFISFSFGRDLNNSGDTVKLLKVEGGSETIIDQVSYGSAEGICAPESEFSSIGRSPDGVGSFVKFSQLSRDSSNNKNIESCQTSTISPTPSSEPTKSPTPIATFTELPKTIKTPAPQIDEEIPSPLVLSVSTQEEEFPSSESFSPSPTIFIKSDTEKKSSQFLPAVFIISGVLFFLFPLGHFLLGVKKRYNKTYD